MVLKWLVVERALLGLVEPVGIASKVGLLNVLFLHLLKLGCDDWLCGPMMESLRGGVSFSRCVSLEQG